MYDVCQAQIGAKPERARADGQCCSVGSNAIMLPLAPVNNEVI